MLNLRKKLTAAFLIAAFTFLSSRSLISAEPTVPEEEGAAPAEAAEEAEPALKSDMPVRTDDDLLKQAELYAENEFFRLYVVKDYTYMVKTQIPVLDEGRMPVLDENGEPTYQYVDEEKTKQDMMFGVQVKSNGFIWWSSPLNAVHDTAAQGAQIDTMSSSLNFISGNPVSHTTSNIKTNTRTKKSGSEWYVSACKKIDKIANGAKFSFEFPKKSTSIVMEVTLDGDSLLVSIPQSGIKETAITGENGSVMLTVSVLNSFGAAKEGEEGYIVVPDGSGALINFDNKKTNAALYSGRVYGRDFAVSQEFAPPVNEQVYLPMYGIVRKNGEKGDNALVAVAEKGDENAVIRANVSRQNATTYNAAWFDFTTRTTDSYYIGTRTTKLDVYEGGAIKTGDIAVRYYPLSGNELTYADVAAAYREHLIKRDNLKVKTQADSAPYYLTLNGGTVKTHSIAGFPVDLQTAGTTYKEAKEIVESLKNGGVSDLTVTYNDFNTSGIKREISVSADFSSKLGGGKRYKTLADYVSQNGFSLYPSFNFMSYFKSGNGYSFLLNSSKQVTKSYAAQTQYEYAFGTADKLKDAWTVLSPYFFPDVFDSLLDSLKTEGIRSVSLNTATYMLYSDFSRKNPFGSSYFNRRDTVDMLTDGYKKLNDAGVSILAQSANAYALPYVDVITNVPLYSSNYDIFDSDIPLYQMVIHGIIPYTTKAFNKSADADKLRLLSLSTGTPMHYDFIYENPNEFSDSDYNGKFYANYKGWLDKSLKEYGLFDDLISDLSDKKITAHRILSVYEYETTFDNGKKIYVNTDTGEIRVNGIAVNFAQYGLERGVGHD